VSPVRAAVPGRPVSILQDSVFQDSAFQDAALQDYGFPTIPMRGDEPMHIVSGNSMFPPTSSITAKENEL